MPNEKAAPRSARVDNGETILDAVIVGAGWSGLYLLHRLRQVGLSVRLIEAGDGIGGAWFWNRYPGARCDVPSENYCYTFDPDIWRHWTWSERYASQPEIEEYANFVAKHLGLFENILLGTRVVSMQFDEAHGRWRIGTHTGMGFAAKYCFMATGGYSSPLFPRIEGVEQFSGELYLTARWPRQPVDFSNKRVGVIGTGASGMQTITTLGKDPSLRHLYVFQRTANFAVPAHNHPLSPETMATLRAQHSLVYDRTRSVTPEAAQAATKAGYHGPVGRVANLSDHDFRDHMWTAWRIGGTGILRGISDLYVSEQANARVAEFCRERVKERVSDPVTAEVLCARGHFVGAKRILCEDGYFETYNKSNVTLVDLRATPIRRVVADGIETTADKYHVDVIIAATGFDSGTGALTGIDIIGRDGAKLSDKWEWGPSTYLGIMVSQFPNLFILSGPGSPSIRSNGFLAAEQHAEWLSELMLFMRDEGFEVVEPTPQAEVTWTEHVASVADGTLLTRDDTQYVGANVPGKPRVFLAYAGGLVIYRMICDAVALGRYQGLAFKAETSGDPVLPGGPTWTGPPANPKLRTRFGNPII